MESSIFFKNGDMSMGFDGNFTTSNGRSANFAYATGTSKIKIDGGFNVNAKPTTGVVDKTANTDKPDGTPAVAVADEENKTLVVEEEQRINEETKKKTKSIALYGIGAVALIIATYFIYKKFKK